MDESSHNGAAQPLRPSTLFPDPLPLRRFDQAKPFVTLGILVAAWLFLPVLVKTFVRASFVELSAPLDVTASYVRDVQAWWALRLHSKDEIIRAGAEVARANAFFQSAIQRNSELEAEIGRLEALLRLPSYPEYRYEHARVARRDFTAWWHRIHIRKGRNFDIPVDAPVIFTGGVVGIVREVHLTTAVVELISSPGVRLSGVIEGDSRPLAFRGGNNSGFRPPVGVIENVPADIIIPSKSHKRVVTSGLGGIFPVGLSLAVVHRLEPTSDGQFTTGEVELDTRLGSLTEVTVLVPLQPN